MGHCNFAGEPAAPLPGGRPPAATPLGGRLPLPAKLQQWAIRCGLDILDTNKNH